MTKKKIAIIGAGFCGLALAWHLLEKGHRVELFDAVGIGGGASGMASGLLHPYPGEHGRRSAHAGVALEETKKLLLVAEEALGRPVACYEGILKRTQTPEQAEQFIRHAIQHKDVECLGEDLFLLSSGITVFCSLYLEGLWRGCAARGAKLFQKKVGYIEELAAYDAVFLAAGKGIFEFAESRSLKLSMTKGQLLLCRGALERSIVGKGHLALTEEKGTYFLGSTYEREDLSSLPDQKRAQSELLPRCAELLPSLSPPEVIGCKLGFRVSSIGHYMPTARQLTTRCYVLTGMGSRGLLYHAFCAKNLSNLISYS